MSGKVYEVKIVGVQRVAIRDPEGRMDEDAIYDNALDVGGIPRSSLEEASITGSADMGTEEGDSIVRHADEQDWGWQEDQG